MAVLGWPLLLLPKYIVSKYLEYSLHKPLKIILAMVNEFAKLYFFIKPGRNPFFKKSETISPFL